MQAIFERPDLEAMPAGSRFSAMPKLMTPGSANAHSAREQAARLASQLDRMVYGHRMIEIEGALACARLRDDPVAAFRHPKGSTWEELKQQYALGRWAYDDEAAFVREVFYWLARMSAGEYTPDTVGVFINFEHAHTCDWGHERGLDVTELAKGDGDIYAVRMKNAPNIAAETHEPDWWKKAGGENDGAKIRWVNAWFNGVAMKQVRGYVAACKLDFAETVVSYGGLGELVWATPDLYTGYPSAAMEYPSIDQAAPVNHQCYQTIGSRHLELSKRTGLHPCYLAALDAVNLAFACRYTKKTFVPNIWPAKCDDVELELMLAGFNAAGCVPRVIVYVDDVRELDGDLMTKLAAALETAHRADWVVRGMPPGQYPPAVWLGGYANAHEQFVSRLSPERFNIGKT